MALFTVSGSPHIHNNQSVPKIMWTVVLALTPALLASFYFFGWSALLLTMIAVVSCCAVEYLLTKFLLKTQPSLHDGSAVITGILLAFNVPSGLPWWIMVLGSLVAIGVAKASYGGLGKNLFNPALVGRVFLLISFPNDMTSWPVPGGNFHSDALTGATPLGILRDGLKQGESLLRISNALPDNANLFLGHIGGSLGEISAVALLLGALLLFVRKIITWHIPVAYLGTVAVFTGILWLVNPALYINPLFHLLTGGLILGAFFMATDLTTSPMTGKGMLIYGFGCGVITVLIRVWGAYPEGVSFAILLMNAATPLINKYCKPERFGSRTLNTNKIKIQA